MYKVMVTHKLTCHLDDGEIEVISQDSDLGLTDEDNDQEIAKRLDYVIRTDGEFWKWWHRDRSNNIHVNSHIKYVLEN